MTQPDESDSLVPSESSWFGRAMREIERGGRVPFSAIWAAIPDVPLGTRDKVIADLLAPERGGPWAIESVPGYLSLSEQGEKWCADVA